MNSCGDLWMTDWDDYRYFLAVAEEGSLSAAANRLRASQPTVGRRIASLEDRLEVRLFERHPRGYAPTPAGEAIVDLARRLDSNVRDIGLRIKGQDTKFVGTVSVSTPESMAVYWLIPRLSRLRRLHPGIRIEVHLAAAIADIARGEADLALRFDRPGDDDVLLARKVGRARFGLYAAARYLQRHGTPLALEDLHRHAVIGPAGRLVDTRIPEWLGDAANSEALACNSMLGVAAAVEAGLGIGILPHYMASPERKLQRLPPGIFEAVLDVWLLVHPHTHGAAKMQAVIDFLVRELSADPILSVSGDADRM